MKLTTAAERVLNPGIYGGVLVAILAVVLCYQFRPAYDVQIGSNTDTPLLTGFNGPEKPPDGVALPYSTYRWTMGQSRIDFADAGRQDFDVTVELNGQRPQGAPQAVVDFQAGDETLLSIKPPAQVRSYTFRVPRDLVQNGSLALSINSDKFNVRGDNRDLGIIVTRVTVSPAPTADRFIEPPLGPLVAVPGTAALLGLLLSVLGWGAGGVAAGSALPGLLAGALLVWDRLWLTTRGWYWAWPQVLFMACALGIVLWPVCGWLLKAGHAPGGEVTRRTLATLVLSLFIIRLAGQLHPEIFIWDLGFHANHLQAVERGTLLFTTQPAEFGGTGHSTFYLPTPYLFIIPFHWLLGDILLAIRVFTVLVGTLGALPVYYLAAQAARSARAGQIAAALYLAMPISVVIFNWGITPNIFGEFFALCTLAVLVGAYPYLRPSHPSFWWLSALLLVTVLSHPGVVVLAIVAFTGTAFLWLLVRRQPEQARAKTAWALGALALALAVAFAAYYRNFVGGMLQSISQIGSEHTGQANAVPLRVGGSVSDKSLGLIVRNVYTLRDWFFGGLAGFWNEARAYYWVWPIIGSLAGFWLVWPGRRVRGSALPFQLRLALAACAWWGSVVLLALVGWTTNIYVRYSLFALPVVAIGSGLLLSGIWGRGRAGSFVSLLVLAFFAFQALALWQFKITYGFK